MTHCNLAGGSKTLMLTCMMFRVLLFWMIWTLYSIPVKMAANPKTWMASIAGLSTRLNEPYHDTLYNGLLVGPTKMVTGAFKGAQWKTIIIHSLHARAACQQAIICTGRVTVRRTRNSWVYMISNFSVQSDSRNWKFAYKNTYKRSNRIPREIWLSWRSILGTNK